MKQSTLLAVLLVAVGNSLAQTSCAWSTLGTGTDGFVYDLEVFDDGTGPALYAAGSFSTAGGVPANNIAKWNGTAWSALGSGTNGGIKSLYVWNPGTGPALYVGGSFTSAGGVGAPGVARWNGSSWSGLGSGLGSPNGRAFAAFTTAAGPGLYVGGNFPSAGGTLASNIARWNGTSWSAVGTGTVGEINSMNTFDDGSGLALYAGGTFTSAGGIAGTAAIARWNGTAWSSVGGGVGNGVHDNLTPYNSPTGPQLIACGGFTLAGGAPANYIAAWNGTSWSPLGAGLGFAVEGTGVFDDGSGSALYAVGGFALSVGAVQLNYIAKWNGSVWSALGAGTDTNARCVAGFDDGGGPDLYVGGHFSSAGGLPANTMARWSCTPTFTVQVSEPTPGGVSMSVSNAAPNTALYTLVATAIANPAGSGPFFGLDASAFATFLVFYPLPPMYAFANASGQYSFSAPAGTVPSPFPTEWRVVQLTGPGGLTMSNIVTITF